MQPLWWRQNFLSDGQEWILNYKRGGLDNVRYLSFAPLAPLFTFLQPVPQEADLYGLYWWDLMTSDFQLDSANGEKGQEIRRKEKSEIKVFCVFFLWNVSSGWQWPCSVQGGLLYTNLTFIVLIPTGLEVVKANFY